MKERRKKTKKKKKNKEGQQLPLFDITLMNKIMGISFELISICCRLRVRFYQKNKFI